MFILNTRHVAFLVLLSLLPLYAQELHQVDVSNLFEEIFSNINLALEQENLITKSQGFMPVAKPSPKEKLLQLEQAAQKLQQNYSESLNQLEQKFAQEKVALDRQFLEELQKIHGQIKELSKK